MKPILLYLLEDTVDFDLDNLTCYNKLYENYNEVGGNAGNKLFLSATKSYIEDLDTENTIYYSIKKNNFFISNKSIDEINSSYRAIVLPQANIFSTAKEDIYLLRGLTSTIKKIKIPVFVTGVGAQATSYNEIYKLYYSIKNVAIEFCNSVYKTGGEFSLRGYFTKELFDLLGFKSAVVTGCPSIFQVGRNFKISTKKVSPDRFRPIINGHSSFLKNNMIYKAFKEYNAIYLDQDEYIEALYSMELFQKPWRSDFLRYLIKKYNVRGLELLAEDRIKLFYDIPVWESYIMEEKFNFSFGQRIHGNIISIICGVPAMLKAEDTRTKEMAEYFNIPYISDIRRYDDIYDVYLDTNYNKFNSEFSKKFDTFNQFLLSNNLRQHELQDYKYPNINLCDYEIPQNINQEYFVNIARNMNWRKCQAIERQEEFIQNIRLVPYELKQKILNIFYRNKYIIQCKGK